MDSEQQLALRPISTKAGGGGGFDGNTSFDVYYSMRTGAVPFLWESAPGTPKHAAVTTTTKAVAPDAGGATMLPISTKTGRGGGLDGNTSFDVYYSLRTGRGGGFDGNTSFDVYYSLRTGAVPFLWESAPSTPKHAAATTTTKAMAPDDGGATMLLPAITPPSSYQSFQLKGSSRPPRPAGGVVRALFGVLGMRKSRRRLRRHHASCFELPLRCWSATGRENLGR
ncbi:hypothetical protein ACQ4PT_059169 [Festuca glaucescens]